jgi:RimJ/RimL family protein N-acetyltransferase
MRCGFSLVQEMCMREAERVSFERSEDHALITQILTEPRCYRRMSNDTAPELKAFQAHAIKDVEYIIARVNGSAAAVFLLAIAGHHAAEVHFCFRPQFWGDSESIAREFVVWVWRDTGLTRLLGRVPAYNRLALRLAKACGFQEFGYAHHALHKNKQPYDLIFLSVARPLPC